MELPEESSKKHAALTQQVQLHLDRHPLAGTARSGDTDGGQSGSAYVDERRGEEESLPNVLLSCAVCGVRCAVCGVRCAVYDVLDAGCWVQYAVCWVRYTVCCCVRCASILTRP